MRLQAIANKARLAAFRHAEDHGCIKFVCTCGMEEDTWPRCIKCDRPLAMFNTDAARGSFWYCSKNHPQGPRAKALVSGKTVGWMVVLKPCNNPEIKGHEHRYRNNGGCEELKAHETAQDGASKAFQIFWGILPKWLYRRRKRHPCALGPSIPGCWVKDWYTGTEFAFK
jgi:hypothetical protein